MNAEAPKGEEAIKTAAFNWLFEEFYRFKYPDVPRNLLNDEQYLPDRIQPQRIIDTLLRPDDITDRDRYTRAMLFSVERDVFGGEIIRRATDPDKYTVEVSPYEHQKHGGCNIIVMRAGTPDIVGGIYLHGNIKPKKRKRPFSIVRLRLDLNMLSIEDFNRRLAAGIAPASRDFIAELYDKLNPSTDAVTELFALRNRITDMLRAPGKGGKPMTPEFEEYMKHLQYNIQQSL